MRKQGLKEGCIKALDLYTYYVLDIVPMTRGRQRRHSHYQEDDTI